MANFFKKTVLQLRQPLACFSALAAGCLITGHVWADENDQQPTPPKTNLERLFLQEQIQFSPVPPLEESTINSLMPLRQIGPTSQDRPFSGQSEAQSNPVAGGPTAAELLGVMKQSNQQHSAQTKARVFVPESNAPSGFHAQSSPGTAAQGSGLPGGQLGSGNRFEVGVTGQTDYPTALASWQEPSRSETQDFSHLPLNNAQPTRVARAFPAPASPKIRTGVHRLSNVSIEQFETSVVSAWQDRIRTSTSLDGRYVRVEIPTRVPQQMAMMIDRETQTLNYEGDDALRENWHQLMENIDSVPRQRADGRVEHVMVVDPNRAQLATIQQAAFLIGVSQDITLPARTNQDDQSITLPPGTALPDGLQQGVKDTVKIIQDPNTGAITLIGSKEDLAIVSKIIEQISAESKAKQAQVKLIPLKNVQSEAVAEQLQTIYDASYAPKTGTAKIQAVPSPNSLFVVGQPTGIKAVEDMVAAMDVAGGDDLGGFRAFPLKHLSAADAKSRLDSYFNQANTGEGALQLPSAPVTIIADFRSNTVIVKGAKQFIDQAEQVLKTIDVAALDGKTNTVKIFPLRNTLAEEMAIVLQDAISGQQPNAGAGYNPNQQAAQQFDAGGNTQVQPTQSALGSAQLSLKMIGKDGKEVTSGIMFDVRVTADRNSNSLVVTGPEESMELVESLIEQLDRLPNAETQIKVFQIVNGDAETLLSMLESLFGTDTAQAGAGGQAGTSNLSQLPLQGVSATDGATLVNLRFSFDTRTNTIVASGPAGDLQVVEDLLNRLDVADVTDRAPRVYRLSNAPARDVAEAITAYLDPRNDIVQNDPRTVGAFLQADRSVIVVAETVSNSLIVSATPSQRAEIEELIRGLDRRPPMVKVKVLIAEVDLNSLEEFGVEVGVQDSLLFDRGTSVAADGSLTGIGFPFNLTPPGIPNANATFRETLAGQALSNLAVGRINNSVGYGGLVMSAGNESISILMRALKDKQAVRVLSRPQITTVENLQGRVQIGASVPRVSGTTQSTFGTTQNIDFEDVGVILEVTPRVSPDGMIVMAVNAVKSSVGSDATGITIGFSDGGEPIIAPQINETTAQTTLMARSGQTVVFSGLIQESKSHVVRGAPILSDLPVIGPLFRFESDQASRTELLIIMTPYLINDEQDINVQNQDEMDRMHWCLCDVAEVYGNTDYHGYEGTEEGVQTIYPDSDPSGLQNNGPLYKVMDAPRPGYESMPSQSQTDPNLSTGQNEVQRASYSGGTGRSQR